MGNSGTLLRFDGVSMDCRSSGGKLLLNGDYLEVDLESLSSSWYSEVVNSLSLGKTSDRLVGAKGDRAINL